MAKSQKELKTEKKKLPQKNRTMKKSAPKTTAKKLASREATDVRVGIKKEYPKSKNVCEVTFRLPKIAAPDAKSVCVVGDFNDWNIHANRMKKQKNGDYAIKLKLEPGKEYEFRYLIDESKWENDWNADKYVKSPYGDTDNSVIIV
jgi:1,4-alpha-glucan branching enzyme